MSTGPTFPLSIHSLVTSLVIGHCCNHFLVFFYPCDFVILGIAYIILLMINFFGNGSVIYIFLKVKSLRTPSNMFVVNLALSDWCMMLTQVWKIKRQGLNLRFLFSGSPSHHQCIHSKILDVGHSRCEKCWHNNC